MKHCVVLSAIIMYVLCFAFLGCEPVDPEPTPAPTQTPAPTTTPGPTATPTPAPTPEPLTVTMVSVPEGSFEMGCTSGDFDCESDEYVRHTVKLKAFQLSAYEVTQRQWEAVMGSNPSSFSGCAECPVESVAWEDVGTFITELNSLTGKSYRLPSEAEWEYAARAGTNTLYICGTEESCLSEYTWYNVNAEEQTHAVGQKLPNDWGLYDMTGNVYEWCRDWYDEDYYDVSPDKDPPGPEIGEERIARGGSWDSNSWRCRISNRYSRNPLKGETNIGFRLAHD